MDSRAYIERQPVDTYEGPTEEEYLRYARSINLNDYSVPRASRAFEAAVFSNQHQQAKPTVPNKYYSKSDPVPDAAKVNAASEREPVDATFVNAMSAISVSPPKGILKEASPAAGIECSHDRKLKFGFTPDQEVKSFLELPSTHYRKKQKKLKRQQRKVLARKMEDDDRDTGVKVNFFMQGERVRQGPRWDAIIPGVFSWKGMKSQMGKTEVVEKLSKYDEDVCRLLLDIPAQRTP